MMNPGPKTNRRDVWFDLPSVLDTEARVRSNLERPGILPSGTVWNMCHVYLEGPF